MLMYGECECFVMQMLYVCVLCALCGSSQLCVLHDLQFVNAGRGCNRRPYRRGIYTHPSNYRHRCSFKLYPNISQQRPTLTSIEGSPACLRTFRFFTLSCHLIFMIYRSYRLIMKACSFFTCLLYTVHVSAPYSKVDSMMAW